MTSTASSTNRLTENLKGLKTVQIAIDVDLPGFNSHLVSGAERSVQQAAIGMLKKNGMRIMTQDGVPQLSIEVTVQPLFEPVTKKHVVAFRVESFLRETVTIPRIAKPTEVDSWRHSVEIKYAEISAASDSSPAILNEVKAQLKTFVADWRQANGFADVDDARGAARDDLQGLIDSLGPVYEKILNDAGIRTLHDLVELDADERNIVLDQLKAKNPAIVPGKLQDWIDKATKLLG